MSDILSDEQLDWLLAYANSTRFSRLDRSDGKTGCTITVADLVGTARHYRDEAVRLKDVLQEAIDHAGHTPHCSGVCSCGYLDLSAKAHALLFASGPTGD